jgi:hypothetical protein
MKWLSYRSMQERYQPLPWGAHEHWDNICSKKNKYCALEVTQCFAII